MKLSELKSYLKEQERPVFFLPDGKMVESHYHITEVGETTKRFMDCGGTLRSEKTISLQLWSSIDLHHRLSSEKLLRILELSEQKLELSDDEVHVEYQGKSAIERYTLKASDKGLSLHGTETACLAKENCGIPPVLQQAAKTINEGAKAVSACCSPDSDCC